ncbi:MAG: hypothetical protein R3Y64_07565 [Peptostreptococcaceae bacterium]
MIDILEPSLKLLFFVLSIIWAGRIMILRTDKQIIINPLLIIIAATLIIIPKNDYQIFGITMQIINIILYSLYILITIFGLLSTSKKGNFL